MNYVAVYRTAPAIPGLLITLHFQLIVHELMKIVYCIIIDAVQNNWMAKDDKLFLHFVETTTKPSVGENRCVEHFHTVTNFDGNKALLYLQGHGKEPISANALSVSKKCKWRPSFTYLETVGTRDLYEALQGTVYI